MEGEARELNTFRSGARKVLVRLLGNVLMAGETNTRPGTIHVLLVGYAVSPAGLLNRPRLSEVQRAAAALKMILSCVPARSIS